MIVYSEVRKVCESIIFCITKFNLESNKMKTKIISLVVMALFVISVSAWAQKPNKQLRNGAGQNGKVMRNQGQGMAANNQYGAQHVPRWRMEELNLTQDQKSKIGEIAKSYFASLKELMGNTQPGEDRRAKVVILADNSALAVIALLSTEQRDLALKMSIADNFLKPGQIARGIMFWLNQLNLTPDQKVQVRTILQGCRKEVMMIRNDNSLTQDQKMVRVREIRKAAFEKILALLSPEQKMNVEQKLKSAGGVNFDDDNFFGGSGNVKGPRVNNNRDNTEDEF